MKFLIAILWLIVFTKKLFFWVWLWQLKEYHIGRFKAHFKTEKGKKIIGNYLFTAKLIVLGGLYLNFSVFVYLLLLVFLLEVGFTFRHFFNKTLRIPVITKKTLLILAGGFSLIVLFFLSFLVLEEVEVYVLLLLDILAPLVFTGLVLAFEPVAIHWRKKIIAQATEKRKKFKKLLVIGITGSYGKTSTKEFLSVILSEKFKVLKTKEHQNSEVGISQCILNDLKKNHQVFICEMGAYSKGGIKLLAGIAKPKIGILTGVSEQHLATFGSLENIAKTKYELIESLPKNGVAIFNGKNTICRDLYSKTSIPKRLTEKVEEVKIGKESLSFKIDSVEFKVNLLGSYWVEDLLMAIQAAQELGMSMEEIAEACQKIKPLSQSMRLTKTEKFNVIDASYSANLDGVLSHLDYLKIWPGKKVIIMPCLIELGEASEKAHKEIGSKIGEVCDLAIITSKDCFEFIKNEAVKKGMKRDNILFSDNSLEIFEEIKSYSDKEDVILLESRVPKRLFNLLKIK